MTEQELETSLQGATRKAVAFTQTFVVNDFPSAVRYTVYCNRRPDEEAALPLQRDEERYPDIDNDRVVHPLVFSSAHAAASFLCRSGKVPVWININVDSVSEDATLILLRYCPRFSADNDMIRNQEDGTPPFRILSPLLPPDYKQETHKFDLNWNKDAQ